jgi:adenylyltransferase/sulfurtransferase
MNKPKLYERYQRQILLKGFGVVAQKKLLQAKVLVIGAGGLGCPVLQYLTAAGVGTVGIVDDDLVSLTNLHRQLLYNIQDIGLPKTEVAANKLQLLNDDINIIAYNKRLTNKNALDIIKLYDIVVDGTDNFASRYMINDACVLLNRPLVYGAVSKFEGQVAVFNVQVETQIRPLNYRDIFSDAPKDEEVLNCAEAGVLGVLPGIIGIMQANETIKLITGIGQALVNKILTYNALDNSLYEFNLSANEEAQQLLPKDEEEFLKMDYEWLCASPINKTFEIDIAQFDNLIEDDNTIFIDVRDKDEQPLVGELTHVQIPLNQLMANQSMIVKDNVVVFCQSGKRSLEAAKFLHELFDDKKVYSLKGGIVEWKNKHTRQADAK